MTAGELIDRVDALRPNAYDREQKLRWLRRLDGQILAEIRETHAPATQPQTCHCKAGAHTGRGACSLGYNPSFVLRFERADYHSAVPGTGLAMTRPDTAGEGSDPAPALAEVYEDDTPLLAPFPWDEGVYTAWLFCQIDLHNGEIQKYNQSLSLLASAWRSLADWVNRRRMPNHAGTWRM